MKKPNGVGAGYRAEIDASIASIGSTSFRFTDKLLSDVDLSKIPRSDKPIDMAVTINGLKRAEERRGIEALTRAKERLSIECQSILEPINSSVHVRSVLPELALVEQVHTDLITTLDNGVRELMPVVVKLFGVKQEVPVAYELIDFFTDHAALGLCHYFQLYEDKSVDWLALLNGEGRITIYQFDGELPKPVRHLYVGKVGAQQPTPNEENTSMLWLEKDLRTGNEVSVSPLIIIRELATGMPVDNIRDRMFSLLDIIEQVQPDS